MFNLSELLTALKERGVKIGIATSVAKQYWNEAKIFPENNNEEYRITEEQEKYLGFFR